MNKRHIALGLKLLKRSRLNADLVRYLMNRGRMAFGRKRGTTQVYYPTNLMIELGNVCNLHCKMCAREFRYGQEMDKGFMPLEQVKHIIDEVCPYLDSIGLTGLGETFMYPHLLDVVKYIKERKPSVIITVSTNAHFKGFLDHFLPVLPWVDNVQFSVDGIGEVYETIRPNTDFTFIKDNIQKAVSAGRGTVFMINTVVQKENVNTMGDIVAFAHEVGIHYVNFNGINIAADPDGDVSVYDYFLSKSYQQALSCLNQVAAKYDDVEVTPYLPTAEPTFRNCTFAWKHQYITWDGYVVPCCGKPFPKVLNFGNVHEAGVMAALNSPKMQAWRKLWLDDKTGAPDFCKHCNMLYC